MFLSVLHLGQHLHSKVWSDFLELDVLWEKTIMGSVVVCTAMHGQIGLSVLLLGHKLHNENTGARPWSLLARQGRARLSYMCGGICCTLPYCSVLYCM